MEHSSTATSIASISTELIQLLYRCINAEEFTVKLSLIQTLPIDVSDRPKMLELIKMSLAIHNRLDLQQQRESGLLALIQSAQDLSKHLDLENLLRAIVSRAKLLLGSELAWLSTYDDGLDIMRILALDGALQQSTKQMISTKHYGAIGVVWETRLPFTTQDYLKDRRFLHEPTLDAALKEEGITALAGVPLIWEDKVIGVLFVADRYHRSHTSLHISILSSLASHAAIAISNAKSFENSTNALLKVESARLELDRFSKAVQKAADVHAQLTSLLASGATLSSICDSISNILEATVLILDETDHLVSSSIHNNLYSNKISEYNPYAAQNSFLSKAKEISQTLGRSVSIHSDGPETCRVMLIPGGQATLGSLVIFRPTDFDAIGIQTFERCASVCGISLMAQERFEYNKSRHISLFINSLILPRNERSTILFNDADRLGLNLSKAVALILIDPKPHSSTDLVRKFRHDVALSSLIFDELDGLLVFICSATSASEICNLLNTSLKTHSQKNYRGIVSVPTFSSEIAKLFPVLRRAIHFLDKLHFFNKIVSQNDLMMYSTLFETQDSATLHTYLDVTLGPLINYDPKRGSVLARTLLTYFDCNQNANLAAKKLCIHVNTMHQRLNTIENLIGYLGNSNRSLELHVALRLWSLLNPNQHNDLPERS